MASTQPESSPILRSAWQLHADYNLNADLSVRRHWRLREWVIIISVIATLLAILSDVYRTNPLFGDLIGKALRIFLIIVPITGSVVLALANRFQEGERWLALRTGAEDILRVIYVYRTVLSRYSSRDQWLEERLIEIRRDALQKVKGNLALTPYIGTIPFIRNSKDDGFKDLPIQEYIDHRLLFQVNNYTQKINDVQKVRTRLQVAIFALGGVGSLLAALSNITGYGALSIWVAFSTALAAALGSWLELRQLDWRVLRGMSSEDRKKLYTINTERSGSQSAMDDPLESTVAVYSHIINELLIARDHWISLSNDNQTSNEFYEMVLVVERVLWGKDFALGVKEQSSQGELNLAPPIVSQTATASSNAPALDYTPLDPLEQEFKELRPQAHPHALVLMPAGQKVTADGQRIDFDNVYLNLVRPALEMAGFAVYKWSESYGADSMQELLLADMVVIDTSIEDADIFYNLGLRHAFRKRGILHIREAQSRSSFGTFSIRTTSYHCNKYGRVDASTLREDLAALQNAAVSTWASAEDAVQSPVFNFLSGLQEPDHRSLRTPLATGYWREYNEWRQRITVAQRQRRIGDILLLTEEIENPLIKEEAIGESGRALQNLGRYELALDLYRKGLVINPQNLSFRRQEAFLLNRLGRVDEAIVKAENILSEFPNDSEVSAILGRIYKEMWSENWKWVQQKEKRLKTAFESHHYLLKAIDTYLKAYHLDLNNSYPGINALTLSIILVELAKRYDGARNPSPEISKVKNGIDELRGSLLLALEGHINREQADYWILISMAELKVLTAVTPDEVINAYREALVASRRNMFYLQAPLNQLEFLQLLDIRPKFVQTGLSIIKEELRLIRKEEEGEDDEPVTRSISYGSKTEGEVFLFTGYMISYPNKIDKIFREEAEPNLRKAIETILERYKAGPSSLAMTAGLNAGSEIIFVECCVERGIPVQVYFPVSEASYVRKFVAPGGDQWVERFYRLKNHPLVNEYYQTENVGLPTGGDNRYARNNRWALYSSLVRGIDKVRLITLWRGKTGTSKDLDSNLVNHMTDLMRDTGGYVEQINPAKLFSLTKELDDRLEALMNKSKNKASKKKTGKE